MFIEFLLKIKVNIWISNEEVFFIEIFVFDFNLVVYETCWYFERIFWVHMATMQCNIDKCAIWFSIINWWVTGSLGSSQISFSSNSDVTLHDFVQKLKNRLPKNPLNSIALTAKCQIKKVQSPKPSWFMKISFLINPKYLIII